jgi:hypothetical protein
MGDTMKRLGALTLSVIAAMAIGSYVASSYAQQRLTRNQIVGTWTLVSCVNAKGNPPAFCVNPNGRVVHDADGRYILIIAANNRPKLADAPRGARSADEYKSVAMGFAGNFGTWTFNETDQKMTVRVEAALFPQNEGKENRIALSLSGDNLKAVDDDGGVSIWRKAR